MVDASKLTLRQRFCRAQQASVYRSHLTAECIDDAFHTAEDATENRTGPADPHPTSVINPNEAISRHGIYLPGNQDSDGT